MQFVLTTVSFSYFCRLQIFPGLFVQYKTKKKKSVFDVLFSMVLTKNVRAFFFFFLTIIRKEKRAIFNIRYFE